MRTWMVLLGAFTAAGACKEKGDATDVTEGDADTDTDGDTDTDTDADTDADTDTDTEPQADCWVADGDGECFATGDLDEDGTVECAFPTAPEADSSKFLNQCLDPSISVAAFDNAARIPSSTWIPGDPLPPIP